MVLVFNVSSSDSRTHPRWTLPRLTHPRRTLPRRTLSRPDTSPKGTSPTRQFPDQTFPRQPFPRPDISPTVTSRTFSRPDTSPTRHNKKIKGSFKTTKKYYSVTNNMSIEKNNKRTKEQEQKNNKISKNTFKMNVIRRTYLAQSRMFYTCSH